MIQPKGVRTVLACLSASLLLAAGGCQMLNRRGPEAPVRSPAAATAPSQPAAPAEPRQTPPARPASSESQTPAPPAHTRHDAFQALRDAGIKPLDPGSLGYYMDVQDAKLRQQLRHTAVAVTRDGSAIVIILPVAATFADGTTDVLPGSYDVLNSIALVLKEYDRTIVSLDGYTDSSGAAELNLRLSQQRSRAVADYFVRQGIRRPRLVVTGHGEAKPVSSNTSPEGRARNRRIELRIIPLATA